MQAVFAPWQQAEPFGIYIHWPFCLAKCPYCDFNSYVGSDIRPEQWEAALMKALDWCADRLEPRDVTSIFFGGGTPSLMPPKTVGALIEHIDRRWGLAEGVEISLEANPTSAEKERFSAFRAAGINRLSLGMQALSEEALRFLGRQHSVAEAIEALELARSLFPRLSLDLIYARPGQTLEQWQDELSMALTLAADHLSLYQLTIAPGTGFFRPWQKGEWALPEPEYAADLYLATDALCEAAGLPAYEVSNYARPGAECRGNLLYWQGGDYVGVGAGAHGRLRLAGEKGLTTALISTDSPRTWLAEIEEKGQGWAEIEKLSQEQRAWELVLMGLRLVEGVNKQAFQKQSGFLLPQIINQDHLAEMIDEGLFIENDSNLFATLKGRLVLDAATERLLST